jgi:chemotaxis protein methyltransferase WspC
VATRELSAIEQLLASRIGLNPLSVSSQLPLRAAQRRIKDLALPDLAAYLHRLQSSEQEVKALFDEVVVAESWFFRDERPFQFLRDHVRRVWLNDPVLRPLRVLSLGCAGGEEPYSVAILLTELELPPQGYSIDAVDVSARQLAIARRGIYSSNAFRGLEQGYKARYFHKHSAGFELASTIRERVRFLEGNVLDPRLLEGMPPYDVLLCRNLLIYLDGPARSVVMATIDRLLANDGVLLIGHADRLDWDCAKEKFTAVGDPGCFAYRRAGGGETGWPALQVQPTWPIVSALAPSSPPASTIASREPTDRAVIAHRAGEPGGEEASAPEEREELMLARAAELANHGRFDEAIAVCQRYLQRKGLSAAAYSLMGMICQAAGDRERAADCFQKAVYLDPGHDEALLALALLAERRGDYGAAASLRQRAWRSLAQIEKRVN